MDDWSFPCGVKINGKGLLILAIDCQMVGPMKPLHLTRGFEARGEICVWNNLQRGGKTNNLDSTFVIQVWTEKACPHITLQHLVSSGQIRLRGTLGANASLLVRQTEKTTFEDPSTGLELDLGYIKTVIGNNKGQPSDISWFAWRANATKLTLANLANPQRQC